MEEKFQRQIVKPTQLPATVVAKWSINVLAEGFVPFPKKLLRSATNLFPGSSGLEQLTAVLAVVDYSRPNLSRLPSAEYLAFIAGMPTERFSAILIELQEKGYINFDEDPEGLTITMTGLKKKIVELTEKNATGSPPPPEFP